MLIWCWFHAYVCVFTYFFFTIKPLINTVDCLVVFLYLCVCVCTGNTCSGIHRGGSSE